MTEFTLERASIEGVVELDNLIMPLRRNEKGVEICTGIIFHDLGGIEPEVDCLRICDDFVNVICELTD